MQRPRNMVAKPKMARLPPKEPEEPVVSLTKEEQEFLKKVEEGHIEEAPPKEESKVVDQKYAHYYTFNYRIDPEVGLVHVDYDLISKQRRMVFNIIKQIGGNILHGQSVMYISLPVYVFEGCTMLDRFANIYAYVNQLLVPAVPLKDPLEKMKRVMTWAVVTMNMGISQHKPFNPILGETLQGNFGNLEVFAEQTEHHPPVTTLMLVGENIKIYSTHDAAARTYPNSASIIITGKRRIEFLGKYPTTYTLSHPQAQVTGLMFGRRVFNYLGDITFKDKTNGLYGIIRLDPYKPGFFSSIFAKKKFRDDHIKGFITNDKTLIKNPDTSVFDDKGHISYCEGNWIESLSFDGKSVYELNQYKPEPLIRKKSPLPSDASLRQDVQALIKGDEAESQRWKDLMENVQRNDRKLRDKAKKEGKW